MAAPMGVRLLAGRYRLLQPLGQGGMGVVWRSRDELLGRDVAVKEVLIPPELSHGERETLRERTLREARSAARLSHPNVVTIFDVVEEAGRPWIVMEFVASRSLAEVLREDGPLPPRQVAEVGRQVLAALRSLMPPACCTATSSPATCCWAGTVASCSPTSVSPRWKVTRR